MAKDGIDTGSTNEAGNGSIKKTEEHMDRRQFLKSAGVGSLLLLGKRVLAAPAAKPAAVPKPRPPGTCGGWTDKDGNGMCDNSERNVKPCGNLKCPGNAGNVARAETKKNGAPAGTCALWKDPEKKGFCAVCADAPKPCLYTICPAHRDHAGQAVKG